MPASLYLEEALLKGTIVGSTYTAPTKLYVGLSIYKPSELKKSTTGTEFETKEPTTGNGWKRIEIKAEAAQWEAIEKGEGIEGSNTPTKYKNKNAVKFEKLTGGEYLLETFAICDALTAGNILYFGKLTTKVTINTATTEFTIPAKELLVEAE